MDVVSDGNRLMRARAPRDSALLTSDVRNHTSAADDSHKWSMMEMSAASSASDSSSTAQLDAWKPAGGGAPASCLGAPSRTTSALLTAYRALQSSANEPLPEFGHVADPLVSW